MKRGGAFPAEDFVANVVTPAVVTPKGRFPVHYGRGGSPKVTHPPKVVLGLTRLWVPAPAPWRETGTQQAHWPQVSSPVWHVPEPGQMAEELSLAPHGRRPLCSSLSAHSGPPTGPPASLGDRLWPWPGAGTAGRTHPRTGSAAKASYRTSACHPSVAWPAAERALAGLVACQALFPEEKELLCVCSNTWPLAALS